MVALVVVIVIAIAVIADFGIDRQSIETLSVPSD